MAAGSTAGSTGSTSSLLELRENPSRWVWAAAAARVPPTAVALSRCGFRRGVWADGLPRDAPNLLLLLHGLGDAPDMYARFGAKLALPQTSALALAAPLPLPLGIEGGAWFESFEADGRLIDGADASDQRRPLSLARDARRLSPPPRRASREHGASHRSSCEQGAAPVGAASARSC